MAEMTPMMKQYLAIKAEHPGCLLFFRLGDFYEMFFEDAKIASRELELVLTGRDCGQEERAPMCGVPFHSYESYVARLVAKGYKVAICEQMEDPAKAQGLVKRDIVRIITPGTVIEGSMLDEGRNNYLCTVFAVPSFKDVGVCFADCSTGDVHLTRIIGDDAVIRLQNEMARFRPSEILVSEGAAASASFVEFVTTRLGVAADVAEDRHFALDSARDEVCRQFAVDSLDELGLNEQEPAVQALGCAITYLRETQMGGLERIRRPQFYSDVQFMKLDLMTRRNLELIETMRNKEKRGSLLGVLDKTKTAMGKRLIRRWIEQPLIQPAPILRRHNAVEELVGDTARRGDLFPLLSDIYDLERIMTRIVYGSANAKELRSLCRAIECLRPVKERLSGVTSAMLCDIEGAIDPLGDVHDWIDCALEDDPPFSVREGGMIRKGYHAQLDELRGDMNDGKGIIARIEAEEKEKTGIKTLKVGYNRVFGYYIEISRSYSEMVPEHYIRKQTLANAERYITQELKELETRVLTAKDRSVALEYQLFTDLRLRVANELHRIQATAEAIAQLDVLCSFAEVAVRRNYCRPTVTLDGGIVIEDGRHPVVEALLKTPFVPNDTHLDGTDNRVALITGPNMAGKSTYMRQTALIVLMAQCGCFVPAKSATIGIVDSIFTRVGASDDLSSGQSTFMVEMSEVATILKNATKHSLVIFDEIGRGTSTFDGMSIARAVLEYVADTAKIGAKTLFATHYHELTVMEEELDGIRNYNIAAKKRGDSITFLRRIVRGAADESYGIEVAKLAGVPDSVVRRAKDILHGLEVDGEATNYRVPTRKNDDDDDMQLSLLSAADNDLVRRLAALDINTLTPIEALQTLYAFSAEAKSLSE
ncbi:MAG: DNA mismatch repair protein MutS [Ruminococcaceae bacterium]|nr:DNA mismatch repair protein MutS [Oscillospiraceae bacterium]